jgi:hypothetical protein
LRAYFRAAPTANTFCFIGRRIFPAECHDFRRANFHALAAPDAQIGDNNRVFKQHVAQSFYLQHFKNHGIVPVFRRLESSLGKIGYGIPQNRNIINIALSVPSFSGDPVHVEIAMIQADGLDGDPIQTYGVGGSDNYSGFFRQAGAGGTVSLDADYAIANMKHLFPGKRV